MLAAASFTGPSCLRPGIQNPQQPTPARHVGDLDYCKCSSYKTHLTIHQHIVVENGIVSQCIHMIPCKMFSFQLY